MNLKLSDIRTDGGTQSRVQPDQIAIGEYAQAMKEGAQFPPVVVFHDGTDYWLADGFHRVEAAQWASLDEIAADVHKGTLRDATWFAMGANKTHGVRLNQKDSERVLGKIFADEQWKEKSLREIATHTGIPKSTVADWHKKLSVRVGQIEKPAERLVSRNGTAYVMNTAKIGKPEPAYSATFDYEQSTPAFDPPPVAPDEDEQFLDDLTSEAPGYDWTPEPESTPEPPATNSPPTISAITIHNTDAQNIHLLDVEPVHLVVTSPPYNVGIEYTTHDDNLLTYIPLLKSVWRHCYDVMTEGARIAVVVPFGIGRNPYIPFDCQIMDTLINAGFTLRGRIIWDKNTTGNRTSWGSWRLPSDPSIRDTTECIIVAHKGNSKLEIPDDAKIKDGKGVHTEWLADPDYFMELAQDHWNVQPESAKRIGHPAPFPAELVKRLIHFYAYVGAHILDPFAGSGSVGVAAKELGCDATLIEIDKGYCELAKERLNL